MLYHSLVSCWNHGNAHFLRGIATELLRRGHEVQVCEPADSWSVQNLIGDHGTQPLEEFAARHPSLRSMRYERLDFAATLHDADLVIVHEWNAPETIRWAGENRPRHGILLFHDTHHRAATAPEALSACDFSNYNGVLAYGNTLRDAYLERGWARRAWTWHEAADVSVFRPLPESGARGDLVWIGNWGDDERAAELEEFLIRPVEALGLDAAVYGVRYPAPVRQRLARAGIRYGGWLPNYKVPEVFAQFRATLHVPRRPYVREMPGIPTIRPFEALACGIPLVCSPWEDREHLFSPGNDFLMAGDGNEMIRHLDTLLHDANRARELSRHGRRTILERHTCAHRVDELFDIYKEAIEIHG